MVTKEQAAAARHGEEFHYTGLNDCRVEVGPRGGRKEYVTRVRVTGQCKTWKRDTARFRLPVKYGLYESGYITADNAHQYHTAADCPLDADARAERRRLIASR